MKHRFAKLLLIFAAGITVLCLCAVVLGFVLLFINFPLGTILILAVITLMLIVGAGLVTGTMRLMFWAAEETGFLR
jgi:hypothetical protein